MGLDEYRKKRDFRRTPEPDPGKPADTGERVFVIHRHEARNLHYDLRLEVDGVLKSWAVPKGFSYDPKDKRLAVRTEDHPIEYEDFEGVIPRGEYGGGTMMIWDRGTFEVVEPDDVAGGVADGKLEILLHGRRMRGEWHMVQTKGRPGDTPAQAGKHWLIFKARDRYAAIGDRPGLSMDLTAAEPAAMPRRLQRMEAGESVAPFSDPRWLFEAEFDGLRVQAIRDGDSVSVRGGPRGLARRLPALVEDLRELRAEAAILDGVLVAMDEHGRPSPAELDARLAGGETDGVALYAFDLLHFDGYDLRGMPLVERKAALSAICAGLTRVLFVDHVIGSGVELADTVARAGLPGIIAKRSDSAYAAGPSSDWRRVDVEIEPDATERSIEQSLSQSAAAPARRSRVKLSNTDKVYWPQEGYTKGDLLRYYDQVADFLLPYLCDRPLHLNRFPDGIDGKSFYQHQLPDPVPDWVTYEVVERTTKEKRHPICNNREMLLYLVNLGSIDLHPWMSRLGNLEHPDWVFLDLDPKGAPFTAVVRIARECGKLLRGVGMRPVLKTSGKSGLHVVIPLRPRYSYEQARMFCEAVARCVAREHKEIATVERVIAQREGRVYIDFMQNRRGQTVVPPYVVRPAPGATVSTPLSWDELDSDLDREAFTIHTVPARLAQVGDLARGMLSDPQDLLPAIVQLQELIGS